MRYPPVDDILKKQQLVDQAKDKKGSNDKNDEKTIDEIIKEMEDEDDGL